MFIIGLTGGIGSGKTVVSDLFQQHGITIVDADVVSRQVVVPGSYGLKKIVEHFGETIVTQTGELDRRQLREIIFKDPTEKQWLEALLHPLIQLEIKQQLQQAKSLYTILVSPLLLETQQHQLVHRILVVDAPSNLQIERTTSRDSQTEKQVRAIIDSQLPREERLKKADDIIINDADFAKLKNDVAKLHQFYTDLANQHEKADN